MSHPASTPDYPATAPPAPSQAVEVVYPLLRRRGGLEPFPTIYYLRDPSLVHAMSELERRGFLKRFQDRLAENPKLRRAFHDDHARYRDARRAMLTAEDRRAVEASGSLSRAFSRGIAGIANFDRIKCLHAHYAHHLILADTGGTVVGRLIDEAHESETAL